MNYLPVSLAVIFSSFTLYRFIALLDSVLPHLVPSWDYSLDTFNQIKVRQRQMHCGLLTFNWF